MVRINVNLHFVDWVHNDFYTESRWLRDDHSIMSFVHQGYETCIHVNSALGQYLGYPAIAVASWIQPSVVPDDCCRFLSVNHHDLPPLSIVQTIINHRRSIMSESWTLFSGVPRILHVNLIWMRDVDHVGWSRRARWLPRLLPDVEVEPEATASPTLNQQPELLTINGRSIGGLGAPDWEAGEHVLIGERWFRIATMIGDSQQQVSYNKVAWLVGCSVGVLGCTRLLLGDFQHLSRVFATRPVSQVARVLRLRKPPVTC